MCSATERGGDGIWQMWATSVTGSDGPAARKSRARDTRSRSAGRNCTPDRVGANVMGAI